MNKQGGSPVIDGEELARIVADCSSRVLRVKHEVLFSRGSGGQWQILIYLEDSDGEPVHGIHFGCGYLLSQIASERCGLVAKIFTGTKWNVVRAVILLSRDNFSLPCFISKLENELRNVLGYTETDLDKLFD